MTVRFDLVPRRPFSLSRTGARLARFAERVDRFDGNVYQRLVFVNGKAVLVEAKQEGPPSRATLKVSLTGATARTQRARSEAERVLQRVLGISIDVGRFYRRFRNDAFLGPMIRNHRGLRVAGRSSAWETMLQIVLSQQINLKLAHDMLSDLVERYGRRARIGERRYFSFPTTRRFAALEPEELRRSRLSRAKASTLIGLAQAFESGELSEDALEAMNDDEAVEYLISFRGVGRWTAEFTLLRGLSRMDIFPAGDLGVVKYVARDLLGHESPAREDDMRRFAERYKPYRGLALIYAYAELARREA